MKLQREFFYVGIHYYFNQTGRLIKLTIASAILSLDETRRFNEESACYFNKDRQVINKTYSISDPNKLPIHKSDYKLISKDVVIFWKVEDLLKYYKL